MTECFCSLPRAFEVTDYKRLLRVSWMDHTTEELGSDTTFKQEYNDTYRNTSVSLSELTIYTSRYFIDMLTAITERRTQTTFGLNSIKNRTELSIHDRQNSRAVLDGELQQVLTASMREHSVPYTMNDSSENSSLLRDCSSQRLAGLSPDQVLPCYSVRRRRMAVMTFNSRLLKTCD